MKRTLALLAAGPLIAALAMFMAFQVWGAFMGPDCVNTELERYPSPDGRFDAVIFERGCGATTGFSTQVSVLPRRDPPEEAGNLFIATAGDNPVVLGRWGGPFVRVRWHGPDALVIERDPAARRHLEQTSVGDVTAVYLPLPFAGMSGKKSHKIPLTNQRSATNRPPDHRPISRLPAAGIIIDR